MTRNEKALAAGAVLLVGLLMLATEAETEQNSDEKQPAKPKPVFDPLPDLEVSQPVVCDAVWRALDKDDQRLASVAAKMPGLSPEMRAYVLAATRRGPTVYESNIEWAATFNEEQKKRVLERAKEQAKEDKIAGPIVGAVALAVNAVPVVGQALSAVITLGYALYRGLRDSFAAPPRRGEDQIRRAIEGAEVYKGLTLDEYPPNMLAQDINRKIREWVDGDPFASRLPKPPPRTPYDFAPRISDYRRALADLGMGS